jgi:two-component system, chemotaxis family, protein-glutamate methylesterase/glutaminase
VSRTDVIAAEINASRVIAPEVIAIGCSLGGLNALKVVLGGLHPDLTQAVVVCCHTAGAVDVLCRLLDSHSSLEVIEAGERHAVAGGIAHVAPGGYHLLVENDRHFALSVDDPVCFSRPSIDVMFDSVAEVYLSAAIGVILTGASRDGAEGLARIRSCGGIAVVQTPAGAEAPAMPQAALETAGADHCLPLEEIPALLNRLCMRSP